MKIISVLLFISCTASASLIKIDGSLEDRNLGGWDTLMFSTKLDNSSANLETMTLENYLGLESGSLIFNKEEYENTGDAGWYIGTEDSNEYASYDFGEGFSADYYLLKIGNSNIGDSHYYFDNAEALQYAYIDISDMFSESLFPYTRFNIGRISHVSDFSEAPTVPLPASIWLFGAGLIGFIGVSRRINV